MQQGRFATILDKLFALPAQEAVAPTGIDEAVARLAALLEGL